MSDRRLARSSRETRVFYGWWIVLAVFVALIFHSGAYYSFGVYFRPIQVELGWSRAEISWALLLNQAVHGLGYVIVGSLIDRFDPRKVIPGFALCILSGFFLAGRATEPWHLYLSYGVLVGIGFGLGYGSLAGVIARWFDKQQGLALGLASSGVSVGTILAPPIISRIIQLTSWRLAMSVVGLSVCAVFVLLAFVVKRRPEDKNMLPYGAIQTPPARHHEDTHLAASLPGERSLRQALGSTTLWVVVVSFAAYTFGQQMVMFHIVNHATDVGLEPTLAASTVSLIGVGSLSGRLLMGLLADKRRPIPLLRLSMLVIACVLPVLILLRGVAGFVVLSLGFGLLFGGIVPLQAVTVQCLFGSRSMGAVYGFVICTLLMLGGLGPLTAGYVFDTTHSYAVAFGCASALCLVATGVSLLLGVAMKTDNGSSRHTNP